MSENETWTEPLLIFIGGSAYLKVPNHVKQQYPDWRKQNPISDHQKEGNKLKLTYEWEISAEGHIIDK